MKICRISLKFLATCALLLSSVCVINSQTNNGESVDYRMISAIRQEELSNSHALEHVSWLADVYGPRITGSPNFKDAGDWVMKKLQEWGLSNIHREYFPFGWSWSLERFSAHMTEPRYQPLIGFPKAWTPGTGKPVEAEVVRVDISSESDFSKYHGKLSGKIVLSQPARKVDMLTGVIVQRWTPELLKEAETTPLVGPSDTPPSHVFEDKVQQFFKTEGVIAELDRGGDAFQVHGDNQMSWLTERTDGGTVFVTSGGSHEKPNGGEVVPQVTLAVEHYNRMIRLLDHKIPVKVALDINAKFYPEDPKTPNASNIIAEIPGTDLANEVVLIGAHLDSWQSATGATDNGAGVAAMMEVMRILKAIGAQPRRTIRIALWGGEEEGELGSKAYVQQHLFDRASNSVKPEYENFVAYYNLDNGTGRIRGIWLQENLADAPIFKSWFECFQDLGVPGTIAPRSVAGSDYQSFDVAGLPSFQFMQDRLEYNSRTHHSNMDVVDRVQSDDLSQMAIVAASFAYNTAMRAEKLPRKGLPVNRSKGKRDGNQTP
jgi:carboxypeptidase Q